MMKALLKPEGLDRRAAVFVLLLLSILNFSSSFSSSFHTVLTFFLLFFTLLSEGVRTTTPAAARRPDLPDGRSPRDTTPNPAIQLPPGAHAVMPL
jgi:hypothetical protein